jgi:hypothetical protein
VVSPRFNSALEGKSVQSPKSFATLYWLVWLAVLCVIAITLASHKDEASLAWFALTSGLLGGLVFNFEFGRLMGFLKSNCPAVYSQLPHSRLFEASAFFNPNLLRTPDSTAAHYNAMKTYRSAWLFSAVAVFLPLLLNWGAKIYAL